MSDDTTNITSLDFKAMIANLNDAINDHKKANDYKIAVDMAIATGADPTEIPMPEFKTFTMPPKKVKPKLSIVKNDEQT